MDVKEEDDLAASSLSESSIIALVSVSNLEITQFTLNTAVSDVATINLDFLADLHHHLLDI